MKSAWRSAALLSTGALILLIFHFQERDRYQCKDCLALREVKQWRIGLWPLSLPLAPKQTTISSEQLGRDMLGAGHSHTWEFAQGSPYAWFGTKWFGCSLGRYREDHWVRIYAESPDFRLFIKKAIQSGQITEPQIIEAMKGRSQNQQESGQLMSDLFDRFLDSRG